jgi:hypothetical protein
VVPVWAPRGAAVRGWCSTRSETKWGGAEVIIWEQCEGIKRIKKNY